MKYYWIGWYQPTEDPRPKMYPPNESVMGWWRTGMDGGDRYTLCAWVKAMTADEAQQIILKDWPEADDWRFCDPSNKIEANDRFPLNDWMKERLEIEQETNEEKTDKQKKVDKIFNKTHTTLVGIMQELHRGTDAVAVQRSLSKDQIDSLVVLLTDIKSTSDGYIDFLFVKPIGTEKLSPQLYYIQEKDRIVGNSATWWRKNDQGYSCHLEEAGKYCEEEMIKRTKDVEDVGWPVEDIDEMATRQVDVQKMHRHLEFINKKLGIESKEA